MRSPLVAEPAPPRRVGPVSCSIGQSMEAISAAKRARASSSASRMPSRVSCWVDSGPPRRRHWSCARMRRVRGCLTKRRMRPGFAASTSARCQQLRAGSPAWNTNSRRTVWSDMVTFLSADGCRRVKGHQGSPRCHRANSRRTSPSRPEGRRPALSRQGISWSPGCSRRGSRRLRAGVGAPARLREWVRGRGSQPGSGARGDARARST